MKKSRRNIVLIITAVVICLYCDSLLLINYYYKNQKLYSMETPMDIANEYMQSKYDGYWKSLKGVFSARKEIRDWEYVVGRRIENIGRTYFYKVLDVDSTFVGCRTPIEGMGIEISSDYPYLFERISVYVSVYNEEQGYWERRHFVLKYEDGEYIVLEYKHIEKFPNKSGLEEVTGMTIEEIIEIADKQQEECENVLYEMKEAELKRNKVVLFLGLLLVNGTGTWLIIRKGLKVKLSEALE